MLLLAACPPVDDEVPVEPVVLLDASEEDAPAEEDPAEEDPAAEELVPALDEPEPLVPGIVNVTVELSANVMVVDAEPSAFALL